jgi:hypothetical protein
MSVRAFIRVVCAASQYWEHSVTILLQTMKAVRAEVRVCRCRSAWAPRCVACLPCRAAGHHL